MKIDPKRFRTAAGRFATGITTVLTYQNEKVVGLTANSFVSISLDPCLVLFSIQNSSSFMPLCSSGQILGISILSEQQRDISDHFAGFKDTFEGQINAVHGCPIVDEALSWFTVKVKNAIEAGDHHMILCEVTDLGIADGGRPLIYYSGYEVLSNQ